MTNPNVTVSPSMSLPVPNLADPGPDYASNVDACLNIIDGHTHTGAPTDGKQLDLSKQLCTADLQLNGNNLGTTRSVELVSQPGALTGTQDVNCLYVNAGTLGFNNSSGTFVPLTGPVSALVNNFNAITTTTNHAILATDSVNFIGCDSTGGAIAITLPRAATILPTPQWRFYLIQDISGAAPTHAITIQVTGGSGDTFVLTGATSVTIQTALGYIAVVTDGVSIWHVWDQSTFGAGEVLDIHGGTLNFAASSVITGTATMTALSLAGVLTLAMGSTASATFQSGSTLAVQTGATTAIDAALLASSGNALLFGLSNVALTGTTGTTTLTAGQYNHPTIVIGVNTLTGDITIAFPSVVGAVWKLSTLNITLAGHAINVTVGSSGPVTLSSSKTFFEVVCIAANTVQVFTSG